MLTNLAIPTNCDRGEISSSDFTHDMVYSSGSPKSVTYITLPLVPVPSTNTDPELELTSSLLAQRDPHSTREDFQRLTFQRRLHSSLRFVIGYLLTRVSRYPLSSHDLSAPMNRPLELI